MSLKIKEILVKRVILFLKNLLFIITNSFKCFPELINYHSLLYQFKPACMIV